MHRPGSTLYYPACTKAQVWRVLDLARDSSVRKLELSDSQPTHQNPKKQISHCWVILCFGLFFFLGVLNSISRKAAFKVSLLGNLSKSHAFFRARRQNEISSDSPDERHGAQPYLVKDSQIYFQGLYPQ